MLPRHLTSANLRHCPDPSLLPRTLTELVVLENVDLSEESGNVAKLPPHLKILAVKFDFSKVNRQALPTTLRYYIDDSEVCMYAKTSNQKLSLQKSGWTTLVRAAQTCDFEGLDMLIRFYPHFKKISHSAKKTWMEVLLAPNRESRKIPFECFDWLRNRGLCSNPAHVWGLSFDFCWKVVWQDRPDMVVWCSEKFTTYSWKKWGPGILASLNEDVCLGILKAIHPGHLPIYPEVGATSLASAVRWRHYVAASWLADAGYQLALDQLLRDVAFSGMSFERKKNRILTKFVELDLGHPKYVATEEVVEFLSRNFLHHEEETNQGATRLVIDGRPATLDSLTELISKLWAPGDASREIFMILELFEDTIGLDLKTLASKLLPGMGTSVHESELLTALHWFSERLSIKEIGSKQNNSFPIAHYAAKHNYESILRYLIELDFDFEEKGGPDDKTVLEMIERKPLQNTIRKLHARHKKYKSDYDYDDDDDDWSQ